MLNPIELINIDVKKMNGTHIVYESKNIIEGDTMEEHPIKVKRIINSALVIRYPKLPGKPFALYGIYEQYWKKEGEIFQLADPDLYMDDKKTFNDIIDSEYFKELAQRPVDTVWESGYWGLTE